ncbi:MAG: hypothetical protein AABY01_05210 [Nanoarchaeota archaeon]
MNKLLFATLLLALVIVTGCAKQPTQATATTSTDQEVSSFNDDFSDVDSLDNEFDMSELDSLDSDFAAMQ